MKCAALTASATTSPANHRARSSGNKSRSQRSEVRFQIANFGLSPLRSSIDSAIVLRSLYRSMARTTLSPKFQIVIPKEVRTALKLEPGSKFNVIEHEGRIELLPVRSAKQMRGFLRGIDTSVPREKDRV